MVLAGFAVLSTPVAAETFSLGVPFWVPESLYLNGSGSVVFEPAFGFRIDITDFLWVPIAVAVDHLYPARPQGDGLPENPRPWLQVNSVLPSAMLMVRLPLGRLYFDFFGGGALLWNVTANPAVKNIELDIAAADHTYSFTDDVVIDGGRYGWGWLAGGGFGMAFDKFSVGLSATYRVATSEATVTGNYFDINDIAGTVTGPHLYDSGPITLRFAGIIVGIEATVEM